MIMKRTIREVAPTFTEGEADSFTPSISPESLPYILSSVVPHSNLGPTPMVHLSPRTVSHEAGSVDGSSRSIKKYYISTEGGALQIYQGAYIYPYWGVSTMYAHVEVVFDEIPIPHESILKWCSLALKGGPLSYSARANQLVVVKGNHLHYLWRVLSIEAEASLPDTRSLDISNLHLWRWHWHPLEDEDNLLGDDAYAGKWVCGRVSLEAQSGHGDQGIPSYSLTTSRGPRFIDWDGLTRCVPDTEPIHKLYMALLGENLL